MFGSEVLEVGIGIALLFLFVSLIATAAQELAEAKLKLRAKDLEKGLAELLRDPAALKAVYQHPFVYSLYAGGLEDAKRRGDLPSYIPRGNFASAIMDLVARGAFTDPGKADAAQQAGQAARERLQQSLDSPPAGQPAPPKPDQDKRADMLRWSELRATADHIQSPELRQAVIALLDEAGHDMARLRSGLESWYDGTMDRVAGWYKRRTQGVLFAFGLLAAIGLNIDAITVTQRLSHDKALRDSVVGYATNHLAALKQASGGTAAENGIVTPATSAARRDGPAGGSAGSPPDPARVAEPDRAASPPTAVLAPAPPASIPRPEAGGPSPSAQQVSPGESATAPPGGGGQRSRTPPAGSGESGPASLGALVDQLQLIGFPIGWAWVEGPRSWDGRGHLFPSRKPANTARMARATTTRARSSPQSSAGSSLPSP